MLRVLPPIVAEHRMGLHVLLHRVGSWTSGRLLPLTPIGPAQRCTTLSISQPRAMTPGGEYDTGHLHGSVWERTTDEVRHGPNTNRHTRPSP